MGTNKFDSLCSKNPRFLIYAGKLVCNKSGKKKGGWQEAKSDYREKLKSLNR